MICKLQFDGREDLIKVADILFNNGYIVYEVQERKNSLKEPLPVWNYFLIIEGRFIQGKLDENVLNFTNPIIEHSYEGVWLTDDLEGFRCKTCGYETVEWPEDDPTPCNPRKE